MKKSAALPRATMTRPVRARVLSVGVVIIVGSVLVGQAVNSGADQSEGIAAAQAITTVSETTVSDTGGSATTNTPLPMQPIVPQGWRRIESTHVEFAMPGSPDVTTNDLTDIAPAATGTTWTTTSHGKLLVAMVVDWGSLLSDADAHSLVSALVQLAVDESNGGSITADTERPGDLGFRRYVEIPFPEATYFGYYAAVGSVVIGIAGFSDDGRPPADFETLITTLAFDGN